jgi:hypothetical protein
MVIWGDTLLQNAFEFRTAVDQTVEIYCNLCRRVIFELHEDSVPDGLTVAQEHLKDFHRK